MHYVGGAVVGGSASGLGTCGCNQIAPAMRGYPYVKHPFGARRNSGHPPQLTGDRNEHVCPQSLRFVCFVLCLYGELTRWIRLSVTQHSGTVFCLTAWRVQRHQPSAGWVIAAGLAAPLRTRAVPDIASWCGGRLASSPAAVAAGGICNGTWSGERCRQPLSPASLLRGDDGPWCYRHGEVSVVKQVFMLAIRFVSIISSNVFGCDVPVPIALPWPALWLPLCRFVFN